MAPLAGFVAKFYVSIDPINDGPKALAVIGFQTSVVGAYYYLAIVKTMYFDEPAAPYEARGGAVENVILTACAAVIVLGYFLNPVLDKASAAAAASLF